MVLIISDQVTSYMSAQRFTFNHFWNLAKKRSLLLWQDAHSLFLLFLSSRFSASQIQGGIGRMILKEEMKARSGSYDNDPWGSARNSRSGSREMLHSMGHNNTVNGCKCSSRDAV